MQPPTIEAAFTTPRGAFAGPAFLAVEPQANATAGEFPCPAAIVHIWGQDGYYALHLDAGAAHALRMALAKPVAPATAPARLHVR